MFGDAPGFVKGHPSVLLRLPDETKKVEEFRRLVTDLRQARSLGDI
jgi:hypothetical protein